MSLEKLQQAFDMLDFSSMKIGNGGNVVTYRVSGGVARSKGLLHIAEIAIAHTEVELNSAHEEAVWQRHHHPEVEVIIFIRGKGSIFLCKKADLLKTGRCSASMCNPIYCEKVEEIELKYKHVIRVEREVIHAAKFTEDSVFIAITMPASEDFPGDTHGS